MEVYLFKLNGWPSAYDERVYALAESVDSLTLFRPAPLEEDSSFESAPNVRVVNLRPARGDYVKPKWLKPIFFSIHVVQAIVFALLLMVIRRKRPDIIHALDYILGGTAANVVSAISRIPFVASVRGLKEPGYRNLMENGGLRERINYEILTALSGTILPRASHIITKAEYQRNFIYNHYGFDEMFSTIPTGVNFDVFNPNSSDRDEDLSFLFLDEDISFSNQTVILFLGKFIPRKGFDILFEFIRSTESDLPSDVVYICVGEFRNEEFRSKIKAINEQLNTTVRIRSEPIPFSQVPLLLHSVDAITLLSRPNNEGVPRVLQEAYVMETPIIASDVTGIAGAFKDLPGCYLVDINDSADFASAVQNVVDDPIFPDRELAKSRFDLHANYRKYANIYRSVLNRNRT